MLRTEKERFKVYFTHELTSCKRKSEFRYSYPELNCKLVCKPLLLLGEIVQRGVKACLLKNVEEERIFYKILGNIAIIDTSDFLPFLWVRL